MRPLADVAYRRRVGDTRAILTALFSWLDRSSPPDVTATTAELSETSGDTGLGEELAGLEAPLFADDEGRRAAAGVWSPAGVRRKMVIARARLQEAADAEDTGLDPLNPPVGLTPEPLVSAQASPKISAILRQVVSRSSARLGRAKGSCRHE